ncbi:MAG: response regulator [Actinobacteria bacterium]|nr:response regulator [Actinomycetota bacterium]MCG2795756.1 response regulator [Actinomycetes bacterium]MBU4240823.1 response regulator [Actinomycetota bacterium]MBU4301847.1 response regulator [Actinomycetota bacterium]MBU4490071.1 response regulator [Actinomycetota bacterium]
MEEGKKLILVADDDKDLVMALSIRLRAAGYGVVGAHDGEEAYSVAQENKPDLIILDVRMPAGGGFSSIDRMKHSLTTRNIPVIFLTAFDDDDMREEAVRLGAAGFFRKPFDDDDFMAAISKVLGI